MWLVAALLVAGLIAWITVSDGTDFTPFMFVVLAFCVASAVSGVGLIRGTNWARDSVVDLSWILLVTTQWGLITEGANGLDGGPAFYVALFAAIMLCFYSLSSIDVNRRRSMPPGDSGSRRVQRDTRIAGVLLMIIGPTGALSYVEFGARRGAPTPDAAVIWFFVAGAALGMALLMRVRWAGVFAMAFSLALCFGVCFIMFVAALQGFGGNDNRTAVEIVSDSGMVLMCFMAAWYSVSSVLRTMRRGATVDASSSPA